MEDRVEWLKTREADFRAGIGPVPALSPLAAANTLDEAIGIIAELCGRLSAAEELLSAARRDLGRPRENFPNEG